MVANNYLDPGDPEVQKHIFNIAMNIISQYDVDGFNLDYFRYLKEVSGTLDQIRLARGSEDRLSDGVSLYSYAAARRGTSLAAHSIPPPPNPAATTRTLRLYSSKRCPRQTCRGKPNRPKHDQSSVAATPDFLVFRCKYRFTVRRSSLV